MVNLAKLGAGYETRAAFERVQRGDAGKRAMFAAMSWEAQLELRASSGKPHLLKDAWANPPQAVSRAVAKLTGTDDWTR